MSTAGIAGTADAPRLGQGLPAWTLRALVALSGTGVVLIPASEGALWGALFVLGPAILASVYAPASPVPSAVVIGAAVLVALTGDDPLRPAVLAMIPVVHLFHVSCGLAGVLPSRGRVHLRALRGTAVRFVVVQAVVFALAGLAALMPVGPTPAVLEVTALVALTAIALVILLWHRQRRDHSHTGAGGRGDGGGATMDSWGEGNPHRPGS
ncbi:hypothetical protein [Actinophytocola sp.]|uniref:hypothetical protein n=1 Tax=Actinophytocola sp. TaxID=1872138 RepID=UPI002EDAB15A